MFVDTTEFRVDTSYDVLVTPSRQSAPVRMPLSGILLCIMKPNKEGWLGGIRREDHLGSFRFRLDRCHYAEEVRQSAWWSGCAIFVATRSFTWTPCTLSSAFPCF